MLNIVILAAGMGKRMKSALPKVLHTLAGRPMLTHVLDSARALDPRRIVLVVGHGAERVQANYAGRHRSRFRAAAAPAGYRTRRTAGSSAATGNRRATTTSRWSCTATCR